MADKNGKEAGAAFLAENKDKPGVITLPSGLQVLREGPGLDHPKVDTQCDCHYAGRLLDGSQFDSSYDRGEPTTFAPNQVIAGWTEAMQLMVQGDKWEMYIPYQLAYGAQGRPPSIPACACLIFTMEIVKIRGSTVPKKMVFPEWTADELALWMPKDEEACQKWRDDRAAKWEAGDEALQKKYATRAELDAWLESTCVNSKNKSLWKRTRQRKAAGVDEPEKPKGPPSLTKESARVLLTKVIDTVKANKDKVEALMKECEAAGPEQAQMMKMMKMMPAMQEMLGPTLVEAGFTAKDFMTVSMQIQAFGGQDPTIARDCASLMSAMQGDLSALFN